MSWSDYQIEIRRTDLYEQVWSKPMVQLAKEYHVSDVALAKVCKKLRVPVPPRGYWAKHAHGKNPRKAQLSKLKKDEPETALMVKRTESPARPERAPEAVDGILSIQASPIQVTADLSMAHRLSQRTWESISKAHPDESGLVRARASGTLDVAVSQAALLRAVFILDSVVQTLEMMGQTVGVAEKTEALLPGASVQFCIREKTTAVEREPTLKEKKEEADRARFPRLRWIDDNVVEVPVSPSKFYRYVPNGKLSLEIVSERKLGLRKTWSDDKRPLEEHLSAFLIGMFRFADAIRIEREQQEKRARELAEQRQREADASIRRFEEQRRRDKLQKSAGDWEQAERLRIFVDAVEAEALRRGVDLESPDGLGGWLSWARAYVSSLDPIRGFFPD